MSKNGKGKKKKIDDDGERETKIPQDAEKEGGNLSQISHPPKNQFLSLCLSPQNDFIFVVHLSWFSKKCNCTFFFLIGRELIITAFLKKKKNQKSSTGDSPPPKQIKTQKESESFFLFKTLGIKNRPYHHRFSPPFMPLPCPCPIAPHAKNVGDMIISLSSNEKRKVFNTK